MPHEDTIHSLDSLRASQLTEDPNAGNDGIRDEATMDLANAIKTHRDMAREEKTTSMNGVLDAMRQVKAGKMSADDQTKLDGLIEQHRHAAHRFDLFNGLAQGTDSREARPEGPSSLGSLPGSTKMQGDASQIPPGMNQLNGR